MKLLSSTPMMMMSRDSTLPLCVLLLTGWMMAKVDGLVLPNSRLISTPDATSQIGSSTSLYHLPGGLEDDEPRQRKRDM